jgi:hypothetical protein
MRDEGVGFPVSLGVVRTDCRREMTRTGERTERRRSWWRRAVRVSSVVDVVSWLTSVSGEPLLEIGRDLGRRLLTEQGEAGPGVQVDQDDVTTSGDDRVAAEDLES